MDKGQFLLYQTPDGNSQIEVKLQNDTVWLSLDQMAELFQRNKSTISRHIKNVLEDGELQEEATIANFATVQNEGTRKVERVIAFYNLDMLISVGYRVHSYRGVQFRIWATKVLKEYIVKGFAMNDDLLKRAGGGNYFDELLARIRVLTRSEKQQDNVITLGNISLNTTTCELSSPSGSFLLTNKEYQMMLMFMNNKTQVISAEHFMEKIWDSESDSDISTVWTYISYLRRKLEALKSDYSIATRRNMGYYLKNNN